MDTIYPVRTGGEFCASDPRRIDADYLIEAAGHTDFDPSQTKLLGQMLFHCCYDGKLIREMFSDTLICAQCMRTDFEVAVEEMVNQAGFDGNGKKFAFDVALHSYSMGFRENQTSPSCFAEVAEAIGCGYDDESLGSATENPLSKQWI